MDFCYYDKGLGQFVSVPRDEAEGILGIADQSGEPPPTVASMSPPALSLVRRLVLRATAVLPANLRQIVLLSMSRVWRRVTGRATGMAPAALPDRRFSLRPEHVYVNLGLATGYTDLELLAEEKRRHGFKVVMICYDMIPLLLPHYTMPPVLPVFEAYMRATAQVADEVLCISRSSERDFRTFCTEWGFARVRTSILRLGSDLAQAPAARPERLPMLDCGRFVLVVGTIEPRKNHELLYQLWGRLSEEMGPALLPLIIAGGQGWCVENLVERIRLDPRLMDRVFVLRGLDDRELAWLYNNCRFTLYPSFYEGWGLPVSESLAYGKAAIVSTTSSLPEAAEGMAPLLDPLDFVAWHDAVLRLMTDDEWLAENESRISQNYRPFGWGAAGDMLYARLTALASAPTPAAHFDVSDVHSHC